LVIHTGFCVPFDKLIHNFSEPIKTKKKNATTFYSSGSFFTRTTSPYKKVHSLTCGGFVTTKSFLWKQEFLILRHPNSTRAHPYPSFPSAMRSCQRAFSTDSLTEPSSTESSAVRQNNSVAVTHEETENFLESVSSQLHCAQQQQKSRCTRRLCINISIRTVKSFVSMA